MAGHIASADRTDWATPKYILDVVREFWGDIDLDPCNNAHAIVHAEVEYRLPEHDGLKDTWATRAPETFDPYGNGKGRPIQLPTRAFLNPPYNAYYLHKKTREVMSTKAMKLAIEGLSVKQVKEFKGKYHKYSLKDWARKIVTEFTSIQAELLGDFSTVNVGGAEVIALIPAQPGTKAWQDYLHLHKRATCNINGRVKFMGAEQGAPMDTVLVYFGHEHERFAQYFSVLCHVDVHV